MHGNLLVRFHPEAPGEFVPYKRIQIGGDMAWQGMKTVLASIPGKDNFQPFQFIIIDTVILILDIGVSEDHIDFVERIFKFSGKMTHAKKIKGNQFKR